MRGINLTLYIGPMFCEKSKHLVKEYRQAIVAEEQVLAFKPGVDRGRYGQGAYIQSKEREYQAPARLVDHNNPQAIVHYLKKKSGVTKVIIDEGSFYPAQQLVEVVSELTERGIKTVIGGLTHYSTREPWGAMLQLAKVDGVKVMRLFSRCDGENGRCVQPAIWSYEKVPKQQQLTVGDGEIYGACCEDHYGVLHQGEVWSQ